MLLAFWICFSGVWISDETLPLVFDILPLGVLISWNSFLVFNILLLAFWICFSGVWISDETLPLVFDILPLGVLISWNSFLVFNILLLAFWIYAFQVLRYQMKHSFSCLMYYFSVFGYQMEHSFSCFIYYFSVFGNQMKHLSIQLGTMYSFRLFMQRKQKIQLWITLSHLSKYKDSVPLADRNRNNLVVLARMNNYLYRGWCQIVKFSNCNLFPQRT